MTDEFVFDSFVSGMQTLFCYGRRFTPSKRPGRTHQDLVRPQKDKGEGPADDVMYISFEQGAFVTNAPAILKKPQIRDSVCGSVFLRSKHGGKRYPKRTSEMEAGGVGCMMHFADLQFKMTGHAENYIIYAESFDPLIDDGWNVVQHHDDENEDDHDEEEGTPSKRHKVC
ncbi:hypothetical protein FPRO04_14753 [Fusarium proliferatum]|nr:hypothetical protein FPRO04_14753 [Fusarium proliferatum]